MAKISLTNSHGFWEVDAEVLEAAVYQHGSSSLLYVRELTAGHCGYPEMPFGQTALDDCTRIECLIMWVESGNHNFGFKTQD